MYKKLGLMCALLRSPQAILLDEPTNGVDPISRREFWDMLYRLADQKILIIVTTAYMDEAERCTRVHLLERGRVMAEGEPRDLLAKEGVHGFDELFMKHDAQARRSPPVTESAPAVEVEDLVVKFGDFTAVDHVSFTVHPGEIFVFWAQRRERPRRSACSADSSRHLRPGARGRRGV